MICVKKYFWSFFRKYKSFSENTIDLQFCPKYIQIVLKQKNFCNEFDDWSGRPLFDIEIFCPDQTNEDLDQNLTSDRLLVLEWDSKFLYILFKLFV